MTWFFMYRPAYQPEILTNQPRLKGVSKNDPYVILPLQQDITSNVLS